MKLVANWTSAWRWISIWAMTVSVAVQGAWVALPAELTRAAPEWAVHGVTAAILIFGIVGRLVDQGTGEP